LIAHGAINGAPASFLIDTGCSETLLHKTFADHIAIPKRFLTYARVLTPDGSGLYPVGIAEQVEVANLTVRNLDVWIFPDVAIREYEAAFGLAHTDGLLGGDVLRHFRAMLDLESSTLRFGASDESDHVAGEAVVARLFVVGDKLVAVEATVDSNKALFIIDTGMNFWGTCLVEGKLNSMLAAIPLPPGKTFAGKAIRPAEQTGLIAKRLEVGGIVSEKVVFAHQRRDGKPLMCGSRPVDGFLGLPFFIKNGLIIDYGRMEVRRKIRAASPAVDRRESAGSLPKSP
jgi:hypothetical protein